MDELIQNPLVRLLRERLGHGGFICAQSHLGPAEFTCGVPWRKCTVSILNLRVAKHKLQIRIRVSNNRQLGFQRFKRLNLYDPTFDPNKMIDDFVKIIKFLKEGYKNRKRLKLSEFPNRLQKKIDAIWSTIGRAENA